MGLHIIRQEKWSEHHSASDSRCPAQYRRNHAKDRELRNVFDIFENVVLLVVLVPLQSLYRVNSVDFSHRENSEDYHHNCEDARRGVTDSLGQVRALEDELGGNEND